MIIFDLNGEVADVYTIYCHLSIYKSEVPEFSYNTNYEC